MSSPNAAKDQARKLLRTLCNFMLPLIRGAGGQAMDVMEICAGIEADQFITELETFISGIASSSLPRSQDSAIEITLSRDWLDNFEETNWLWETVTPDDETMISATISGEINPGQFPVNKRMIEHDAVHQSMPLNSDDEGDQGLQTHLQDLRRYITQDMPVRLLCFELHNSKLKISLLERTEVYNYLALKLRADYNTEEEWEFDDWIESPDVGYAILSHTWNQTPGELTYGDWQNGSLDETQPKCQKLVNFCKAAFKNHGLTLGWIDTVCINKESSAELDESIRSMYAWYRNARVCITYLAGTFASADMHNDPWFTRGWTFQELVAPNCIKFYNTNWNQLSTGSHGSSDLFVGKILEEISLATTMTLHELSNLRGTSISRRMQLVASRQVTREEDIAYCLMGVFNVSISTAYGEGAERAFFRLVEEIFRSTKDVSDIFNWAGNRKRKFFSWESTTSLFPSLPSNYLARVSNWHRWHPIEPLILTHLGLRTPILLMPAVPIFDSALNHQPIGDYKATISMGSGPFDTRPRLGLPNHYYLLDNRVFGRDRIYRYPEQHFHQILTFGILNVERRGTSIHIPKTCLAILLSQKLEEEEMASFESPDSTLASLSTYQKATTEEPIVFNLEKTGTNSDKDGYMKQYYELGISELGKHGMELVTLYL